MAPQPRTRLTLAQARARQRRGHLMIAVGSLLIALSLIGVVVVRGWWVPSGLAELTAARASSSASPGSAAPSASLDPSGSAPAAPTGPPASPVPSGDIPQSGAGTWAFAAGPGAVLGATGDVRTFRVAVENGIKQDPNAFAAAVDQILGDQRSWIGGGDIRFQRVAQAAQSAFTLYLASPVTADRMCSLGGVHTEQFGSCRIPGEVIINLARWLTSVPDYGASLDVYREYAINHEVGRELGHVNEVCPAAGQLAPVMQQQSQGLKGCVANAWPYVNGQLYSGTALP
jgi:hypothetical protein